MGTFANSETADSSGQVNISASDVGYKCKKTLSQPACFFIVVLIIEGCPPRGWNSSSWGRDVKTRGRDLPHPPQQIAPCPCLQASLWSINVGELMITATSGKDEIFEWFTNVTLWPDEDLRVKKFAFSLCTKTYFPDEWIMGGKRTKKLLFRRNSAGSEQPCSDISKDVGGQFGC